MKGFLYGQTEYSIGTSIARLEDYVSEAKRNNFQFLSITDTKMFGCYKFYTACEHAGIKPVLGLEYLVLDDDMKHSKLLLYAKNNIGYRSLLKISSNVNIHKWESLDNVLDFKDNLFIIFVYDNSHIERLFRSGSYDTLNAYLTILKNNQCYIGIPYTNHIDRMNEYKALANYLDQMGVLYLPIHQVRYMSSEDIETYTAITQILDTKETIDDYADYSFLVNPKSNSIVDAIVSNIQYDLFHTKPSLPKYPNTKGISSYEYLMALCHKGLQRRGKYYKDYVSRLEYELSVIHKMGYDDYFLIVWDFIKYSKQNGILVGPGRGSAAGSLVSYCLGITEVDPLKYGLLFERFLNPERVSMPDIDTDFPDVKRDMVINHVREFYGDNHVCSITTFGRFKVKSSINELGKVYNIEKDRLAKIVDMLESRSYEELINQYEGTELERFFRAAKGLEGLPHHISTHAAGIILSEDALSDIIPILGEEGELLQSQYEASDLEKIGLLKMDFLGISNLTMIQGMMDSIPGFTMDMLRNIPLDDPKVYKLLQQADTLGIFQMEKPGFRQALRELKPTDFNDIVAMLALYRPGPMDNIPEYIACKYGKKINYLHPSLEPILRDTYGVIVYQEQIMKIAQVFAGYSLGEADLLRRAVSKKDASKLQAMSRDFITRAIQKGYSSDIAENIYALIYRFADYGFNKSHSVAYALFSYQMLYFKANYFNAFMSNIMNNVISNKETLVTYINYAKARGLITQKPNINVSTNKFVFINNWLYMPLSAIFSIGESVSSLILEERERNGQFRNLTDLRNRVNLSQSNIEALVYAGALDVFNLPKKAMLENSSKQDSIFLKYMDGVVNVNQEYDIAVLREMEKKYIGINLEYNLFRNSNSLYQSNNAIPLSKVKAGEWVTTIIAFNDMKEIKTKKGEYMLLGTIEDDIKSYHFSIFPAVYKDIPKTILDKKSLYVVRGILDKDNREELSFTIKSLARISM